MPVYLDETTTDETNPYIIDFAVFSDSTLTSPCHNIVFKLKPIHIAFRDFEKLFFKKRRGVYTVARLCFLNELFDKIKPKLARLLQDIYCVSNKTSILLTKEIFNVVLEDRIKSRDALTHCNFIRAIDTTNDTYIRITLSLGIHAISTAVSIEFMFKVRNIPPHSVFDADDLFCNAHNLFNIEHSHSCVDPCVDQCIDTSVDTCVDSSVDSCLDFCDESDDDVIGHPVNICSDEE